MLFVLPTVGELYVAAVLLLFLAQRTMIYPAPKGPTAVPPGFEQVMLRTTDGLSLAAAWRPAVPGKRTVLFFHGNGDSLSGAAFATRQLVDAGYGMLLADYRGYSGNPGKPSEQGLILDGEAALGFLKAKGIEPESLVLMGASLGTGVATQLASRHRPAALVLVSPFTSLPDVGAVAMPWAPVRALMLDRFDSLDAMPRVSAPVLVLHARDDRLIPFAQAEALAGAARNGRFLPFDRHGHQLQYEAEAQDAVVGWLASQGL
ncbi:alpha/beta hydrolase [Novosphingobium sp. BL-8H]|uniref:alpha/beta hydrolase n=1 Tax=Novosphingobium sp. BL-8H TaxID=3127640 RepID=UPI003756BB8F